MDDPRLLRLPEEPRELCVPVLLWPPLRRDGAVVRRPVLLEELRADVVRREPPEEWPELRFGVPCRMTNFLSLDTAGADRDTA